MENKVEKYIKQLLFENDCVIIPEFGGFVTSYRSSEIHPIKHHFTPPSKRVAFNEKLKLNDGLLISHIANEAKISLQEATKWVNDFANTIIDKIKSKEKILIDGVGELFKNQEGRVQFKAEVKDNFLEESFGLPDFFAEPIIRDENNIKLKNIYKDRKAMSTEEVKKSEQGAEKKKKKGGATIWVLSIILVLLSGSAVYLFLTDHGQNSALSSFFPWNNKVEEPVVDTTEVVDEIMEEDTSYMGNTEMAETSVSGGETFLSELTGRYYVICGGFSVQKNAENLRDELITKGYDAKVLSPLGVKPLFRVSIADYETQQEGIEKLGQENPEFENTLWVMKY